MKIFSNVVDDLHLTVIMFQFHIIYCVQNCSNNKDLWIKVKIQKFTSNLLDCFLDIRLFQKTLEDGPVQTDHPKIIIQ